MATYEGKGPEKRSKKHVPPSPKKQLTKWQLLVNKYSNDVNPGSRLPFTQTSQSIEDEYAAYTSSRVVQTDILQFWQVYVVFLVSVSKLIKPTNIQANEWTYPTIFKIAMDYLPVQASSVPCERVFSSSGETDTKKRNRIALELMEALQIRKYNLKGERLDFVKHWVTPVTDLTPDDEVEDIVQNW